MTVRTKVSTVGARQEKIRANQGHLFFFFSPVRKSSEIISFLQRHFLPDIFFPTKYGSTADQTQMPVLSR